MTFARVLVAAILICQPQSQAPSAVTSDLERMAATERAFAAATAHIGVRDGFLTFLTPDAIDIAPVGGRLAIVSLPERLRAQAAPALPLRRTLLWEPRWGAISAAGDLGWLTGPYRHTSIGAPDQDRHGAYFSIWRRQADGTYKVRLDIGIDAAGEVGFPAGFTRATSPVPARPGAPVAIESDIRMTEARFAEATLAGVGHAYRARLLPDARLHRNERSPFAGAAAVEKFVSATFERLAWAVLHAEVSASGDLAFTAGSYDAVAKASDGRPQTPERGFFVRVWQRAESGDWKIAFETSGIR